MTDFNALLKRSFAQAHEPADGGFSIAVSRRVARREAAARSAFGLQMGAFAIAVAAVAYGLWGLVAGMAPDLVASAGLELARAHGALSGGALSGAAPVSFASVSQTLGAGLTQVLLVAAALAGGAVAFRNAQD